MENNEKGPDTAVKSAPTHALMIKAATLMLKPEEANLAIQEQTTDSPSNSTNTMPPCIICKPHKATSDSKTASLLFEPENLELGEYSLQNVTHDSLLAEQCKKALEKSYGCTIPMPTSFLRKRFGTNRK